MYFWQNVISRAFEEFEKAIQDLDESLLPVYIHTVYQTDTFLIV